jgi:uncharacterized RDD family membrane protein YckC
VPTSADRDRNGSSLTGRIGRWALQPLHAVAEAGRGALADEAERAIDGVMAGPLPEALGRSLVENRVVERLVVAALATGVARAGGPETAADRVDAVVGRALDEIATSPAFGQLLTRVVEAPEVRHALERQTAGFGADVVSAMRLRAGRVDDSTEGAFHLWLHRPPADDRTRHYGGVGTRGSALAADAILVNLVFLFCGALCGLFASLFGPLRPVWLVDALAGAGWTIVVALYFVGFWSAAGQTPGLRMMRLRVVDESGGAPSALRSAVRLVGLALAIIPLFAGFLPVLFDGRRRALQDYLAGTAVVRAPPDEPG